MKIKIEGLMNKPKDVAPKVKVMRRIAKLTFAILDAQDIDDDVDPREQMRVAMVAVDASVDFLHDVFDIAEEKLEDLEQEDLFDKVAYAMGRIQGASDSELNLIKAQEAAAAKQSAQPENSQDASN